MVILGLTGSIGMGKSTAAAMFSMLGVPVHDADSTVHKLTGPGGKAVAAIDAAFPGAVKDGAVDRQVLGQAVFEKPAELRKLESILHPLVRQQQNRFLRSAANRRARLVVLDIPLLFETGGDQFCDAVAVVSAPEYLQRIRVLSRPGMTEEKFRSILAQQVPDAEKRRRTDFVIQTALGKRPSLQSIRRLIKVAEDLPATHWPPKRIAKR